MAAIRETMEALHDIGAIDNQTTRFDDACLTSIRPLKPEEIKAIREREHVGQADRRRDGSLRLMVLVPAMAGHSNAKTTGLYDRRNDDISVEEVERIEI
jgi:hypothetical protein